MRSKYEVITDPSLLSRESMLAEWYKLAKGTHVWIKWRNKAILQMLSANGMSPGDKLTVLDIGSGNGVVLECFEKITNWTFDGADIDSHALEGSATGRGRLLLYDISSRLQQFKDAYDAVFLLDVIEHVPDPKIFLDSVLFHIKPGGRIVVNTPALQSLMGPYDKAAGHLRRYSISSLKEQFQGLPVEVMDVRYWGLSLVPIALIRNIMLKSKQSNDTILKRGFSPPNRLAHTILHMIMRAETRLLKKPPIGASVMAVVKKPDNHIQM